MLMSNYTIVTAKTPEEFEYFWTLCRPHLKAVLDASTFSPVTQEEYTYFLDGEYLAAITSLFEREKDPFIPIFFCRNGEIIGFASYVPAMLREDIPCFFYGWVPAVGLNFSLSLDGLSILFALLIDNTIIPKYY